MYYRADNCNVKAYCNNTRGPYTCACKKGFSGDGVMYFCMVIAPGQTSSCHKTRLLKQLNYQFRILIWISF